MPRPKNYPRVGLVLQAWSSIASRDSHTKRMGESPQGHGNTNNANEDLDELDDDFLAQPRFWKSYQDEAKEQDNEFVTDRNKNLDTMLVFAGLYSAILTAFLIDSTALLKQDPGDVTNALLLSIAQSQWRMETGNLTSSSLPVQLPSFEAPATARAVNCLWYMALMLSLAAAMLAMLAKEWLAAFVTYETRDPHTFAKKRQDRFKAFRYWKGIAFLDWIPILLHISLLLFTLGLILQMRSIDSVVAAAIISASLAVSIFYLWTIILGIIYDFCPYQARVATYIRWTYGQLKQFIFNAYKGLKQDIRMACEAVRTGSLYGLTSINLCEPYQYLFYCLDRIWPTIIQIGLFEPERAQEWDSIEWFLDHARDWENVKIAYHWINSSGLPKLGIQKLTGIGNTEDEDLLSLIEIGVRAIDRLTSLYNDQYYDLIYCQGANAIRYALTISETYKYGIRWLERCCPGGYFRGGPIERNVTQENYTRSNAYRLVNQALPALDDFWERGPPPMTASSNALLLAAELNITLRALDISMRQDIFLHSRVGILNSIHHTLVDVCQNSDSNELRNPILLHRRAIRGFCRGGLLLYYHLQQKVPMTLASLDTLLSSLCELALSMPQGVWYLIPKISIEIRLGTTAMKKYDFDEDSFSQREGLLAGLISLLETSTTTLSLPENIKHHCVILLSKITPQVIGEWIQTHPEDCEVYKSHYNWPSLTLAAPNPNLDTFIFQQLLEVACFAIARSHTLRAFDTLDACLRILASRIHTTEGHKAALDHLVAQPLFLINWVKASDKTRTSHWYQRVNTSNTPTGASLIQTITLRLLANEGCVGEFQCALACVLDKGASNSEEHTEANTSTRLETILGALQDISSFDCDQILRQLQWYYSPGQVDVDLKCFTRGNGFNHLSDIGARNEFKSRVVTITKLVVSHLASDPQVDDRQAQAFEVPEFRESALHGFFGAILFLSDNIPTLLNPDKVGPSRLADIPDNEDLLSNLMQILGRQNIWSYQGYTSARALSMKMRDILSKIKAASEKIGNTQIRDDADKVLLHLQDEPSQPSVPDQDPQSSQAINNQIPQGTDEIDVSVLNARNAD